MEKSLQYLRLYEALTHLKRERGINQTKLAELMGTSQSAISRNLQTAQAGALNLDFVINMNSAVGKIFNVAYIVNGTGGLLADEATPTPEPAPLTDAAAGIVELAARLVAEVEALRKELEAERRALAHEREELRFTMELLRMSIKQDDNAFPVAAESAPEALVKKEENN